MWGNILPSIELTAIRVGQMVIQQNPVHIKMWEKSVCFMSKRKIYHPKYWNIVLLNQQILIIVLVVIIK